MPVAAGRWNVMRLLSYNIHKGIGGRDRRYRIERIVGVIQHEAPDFVCLQEVDRNVARSRHHNQPELLAEQLEAVGKLYQLNVKLKEGGYGNLLLSRWPMIEQHQISLTLRSRKPRGGQLAIVETPDGPVRIINWHLGLAEEERHWQVRRFLEHHLFRQSASLPTVIIGDCNDWRNTLANGPFAVHGYHHVTAPASRFRSFPAYLPMGSLDKAFCCSRIQIEHARVSQTKLTRDASDHLPLIVDFTVKKAE